MANPTLDSANPLSHSETPAKRPSLELPTQPKGTPGKRSGGVARWLLAIAVVGGMGTAGVYTLPRISDLGGASDKANWVTEPATKQRLILKVTEDGNIESASNVDVKCEILGGSTILWIVEDGKRVEKDEIIVRLDESAIDTQLNTQKIAAEKAEAVKIQAEQDYEAAKIAVEEYEKGTFLMEEQNLQASVKIALENLRAAENLYNHTQSMFRKGFVTKQQLESDEFGMQRTELELKSAQTALKVLQDFTRRKMLTQLKSVRDAAAARMRSEQAAWDLEKSNLKKLEEQKAKCVIRAPQDGMVIYANENSRRSSSQVTIEEGAPVRERQTLIKLPDLTHMQVKVPVHETKVEQMEIGMPARITVQDRTYNGKVVAVANQPEPKSWFSAEVKLYATTVAIEGETKNLKPGMTAAVEIFVADIPDALTVNVSAVVEQGGKFYVWVAKPDGPERRPVLLGRTDENVVEIKDGVVEGEQVLLNPRAVVPEAREDDAVPEDPKELPEGIPTGPDAGTAQGKPAKPAGPPKFSDMDKNKDGKLTEDEAPERMKQFFGRVDTDKDGSLSPSEWAAFQQSRKQAGGGPGGPGGPGGRPGGGGPGGGGAGAGLAKRGVPVLVLAKRGVPAQDPNRRTKPRQRPGHHTPDR